MRLSELNISRSELERLADDWIWNTRNKEIFFMKIEGNTYEEIAELYNLSTQRTKEILKDCINKISKHI
jgi:Mor family transcriptional regulator